MNLWRLNLVAVVMLCMGPLEPLGAQEWKNSILPVLGSAPETGMQYGIALMRTRQLADSLGTRPSAIIGNAVRTEKAQTRIFVDTDFWTPGNDWRFTTNSIWQEFPIGYYGVGEGTSEVDEINYTPRTLELAVTVQRRVAEAQWLMLSIRRIETQLVSSDSVTSDVLPPIGTPAMYFDVGDLLPSLEGRHVVATVGLIGDRRDNVFAPREGHYLEATMGHSGSWNGSEYSYTRLRLDARTYRPNGAGVLAGQFLLQDVDGEAPVDQIILVGNSTSMRGYTMGRFRGRATMTAQLEYRTGYRGRWGGAVFGGATVLGSSLSAAFDSRLLPSVGGGVRFQVDPVTRSAIRVDFALGASGQGGLYVAFNEAF
jgi:outer membrane protein assembly factor BamA